MVKMLLCVAVLAVGCGPLEVERAAIVSRCDQETIVEWVLVSGSPSYSAKERRECLAVWTESQINKRATR